MLISEYSRPQIFNVKWRTAASIDPITTGIDNRGGKAQHRWRGGGLTRFSRRFRFDLDRSVARRGADRFFGRPRSSSGSGGKALRRVADLVPGLRRLCNQRRSLSNGKWSTWDAAGADEGPVIVHVPIAEQRKPFTQAEIRKRPFGLHSGLNRKVDLGRRFDGK